VKLKSITIKNLRRLDDLDLEFDGADVFLIAENAGGKTSALTAIARALGRDLAFERADFTDVTQSIEIIATLYDLDLNQQGVFAERIEFGQPITLQIGVLATWDALNEQAEVTHGYPRHGWARSSRDERDALPLIWLPAWRDPSRMLAFGAARGLLGALVDQLPLGASLQQALNAIQQAAQTLGADPALRQLLDDAGVTLGQLIPPAGGTPFDVGVGATTERDLLRQFELLMAYQSPAIPVGRQSSGLGQLAVFVFAARLIQDFPNSLLLVDEPEISLHPQAQRALAALLTSSSAQTIIATHSSNILDGVDPRGVVRLFDGGNGVESASASALSDDEARRLARLSTPLTAESFFARKVVLVEGISDVLAIRAMATRAGRNLDAEGVTLLSLEGGGGFEAYVKLLGPFGLGLELLGLCDADQEALWSRWLEAAGFGQNLDRSAMEALGFFVCDRDLEDEFIQTLGVGTVVQLIDNEGETPAFQAFINEPKHQNKSPEDQIRSFFRKQGRKARYAPLLVDATAAGGEPHPLQEVLARA
jgi:hypothetical protein